MSDTSNTGAWRYLEHTADVRLEIVGVTLEDLFNNAAAALMDVLGCASVREETQIPLDLDSDDLEDLFVEWLRELLFQHETKQFVFVRAEYEQLSETALSGRIVGGFHGPEIQPALEVKAITYHGLSVEKTEAGYVARVIFDI
jgi:SHS2 domain-containing protein